MEELKIKNYNYSGDEQYQPPMDGISYGNSRVFPYLPDPALIKAVNLAIALEQPLLLEGEPGCGKTCLAGAISHEFTQRYLAKLKAHKNRKWPFSVWDIKSTSRARDGLYTFDAVARLRDAQLMGADPKRLEGFLDKQEIDDLKNRLLDRERKSYREFGKLGYALWHEKPAEEAWQQHLRPIVLIDEIDKADSDFANDLLRELDQWCFEIPETGENIPTPDQKPIVLITSNQEKPLPDPFLRRCVYFYVKFPEDRLQEIIEQRFGPKVEGKDALVSKAINRFIAVRQILEESPRGRPPGTSEFIQFLNALLRDQEINLDQLSQHPHLMGTLIKTQAAQDYYITQEQSYEQ